MSGTGTSFWGQRWSEGGGEGAAPAESVGTGLRPPSSLGKEGVSLWHDVTNPSVPQKLYLAKSSSSNEKIRDTTRGAAENSTLIGNLCLQFQLLQ